MATRHGTAGYGTERHGTASHGDGFNPALIKMVAGRRLLYVMAAEAEYGAHLQALFTPLMTGIGPVEAAVELTRCLAAMAQAGQLPDLVISLGSAGSARLQQGAVYQVASVSYRDMDASALGFAKGQTPLLDLPVTLDLPCPLASLPTASLATGASIVSGKAYEAIDADMVDMETFALLRACHGFDLPLIGLRGISDGAEELSHIGDWTQYLHIVDARLAEAVEALEATIVAGIAAEAG